MTKMPKMQHILQYSENNKILFAQLVPAQLVTVCFYLNTEVLIDSFKYDNKPKWTKISCSQRTTKIVSIFFSILMAKQSCKNLQFCEISFENILQ